MRIRRTIIIPAIIALSTAGSIAAVSAVPVAAAHGSSVTVVEAGHASPQMLYRG